MKKRYIVFILVILCLFAYISNPTKADYVSFVKEEITEQGHPIIGMLTSPFFSTFTTEQNFGLFTIYETKMAKKEKESFKAIGFFNHFFWVQTPEKNDK